MRRFLFLLSLLPLVPGGFAQTGAARPVDSANALELRAIETRLDQLQREMDRNREETDRRLASDLAAMNTRFDDSNNSTRWALGLLTLLGVVGSVVGSLSWWTNRKDTSRFLSEQIETIGGIRNVIGLIRESYELQKSRETDWKDVKGLFDDLGKHFAEAYASVKNRILSLQSVSRMGWSKLSVFQLTLAASARAEFRSIPGSVLQNVSKKNTYEFARVCQLLGASALYANDIGHAEQLLGLARETYNPLPIDPDFRESMAATYFFLGLIAKSWIEENRPLVDALGDATRHLEKAGEFLVHKKNEFLVPITLAEVESYLPASQSGARERLTGIIQALEKLSSRDENQQRLLVRAYLLRGNLERGSDADAAYRAALRHDPKNPYATLSIALNSADKSEKAKWFSEGLEALKESRALDKHELTTRATALSWAVIAAHELRRATDRDRYQKDLDTIQAAAVSTGGKIPLFFSPLSRKLHRFEELRSDIDNYLAACPA